MKVIGIDPGLAATGVGIITGTADSIDTYSFGVINSSSRTSLACRLDHLYSRLQAILLQEIPNLMIIEDVFSLKVYPKSGITLGKVSGIILLAGFRAGMPVYEVAVREAKKILTGNGKAAKGQLERAVRQALGHAAPLKPSHASDALALALIGLYRYGASACVPPDISVDNPRWP